MFRRGNATVPAVANMTTVDEERSLRTTGDSGFDMASTRSRASSIFSTGTITSVNTLPQGQAESHHGPIDVVLGRRNFRISARPGSILSISSFDTPAPPYSEETSFDASQSTSTLTGGYQPSSPTQTSQETEHATPIPQRHRPSAILTQYVENTPSYGTPQSDISLSSSITSSRSNSPPSPPLSPLTTSTNAISAHYTSVVRTLDANHRAEIERLKDEHAAALAQTRNDIDAAYRGPYRDARDRGDRLAAEAESSRQKAEEHQIELLTMTARCEYAEAKAQTLTTKLEEIQDKGGARIEIIEAESALAIQRARNEVEDFWGKRMKLAAEEIQRAWVEGRAQGEEEGTVKGRLETLSEQNRLLKNILTSVRASSSKDNSQIIELLEAHILNNLEQ